MSAKTRAVILLVMTALTLWGCAEAPQSTQIPELIEPVGVASDMAVVTRGEYSTMKYYDAAVYAHVEELFLTVDGTVKEVLARPGERVKKGQKLITLNLDQTRERADALKETMEYEQNVAQYQDQIAQLNIDILKVELEQLVSGRADEARTALKRLDIEQAEANLRHTRETRAVEWEADAAELQALENQLLIDAVYAPFDGTVARAIALGEGSRVKAYDTLCYLADDDKLYICCPYVSESMFRSATGGYYALIGDGRHEIEKVEMDSKEYISRVLAGESVFTEFTFKDGTEGVEAGMYAALIFITNYTPDALLIPSGAVLSDANGKYVYVADADGARKRRDVRVKMNTNERMAQVLEGLEEGERIYVTDK